MRFLAVVFLWAGIASAESFNYQALEKIIRDNDVRTVDDLLPLIPEEYRRFYLLMYESRSAQAGNTFPSSPRVILYGKDSTFMMTFTKDPKAPPAVDVADNVETMQWNAVTKKFEFRELVFGEGKDPLENPIVVNPIKCQACHGKDPRPNWDPYNTWAGSYGSLSRLGCDTMQPGTEELRKYQEFMSGNRHGDRYKHLPAEIPAGGSCPDDPEKEVTFRNGGHKDANAVVTEQLTALNHQRLRRIITSSSRFAKFRPFIMAQAKGCVSRGSLESFFPPGYAEAEGAMSYEAALNDVINTGRTDFAQRLASFLRNNKGSAHQSIRQPINFHDPDDALGGQFSHRFEVAQIRILADRMRLSTNRWTLAVSDGQYDFATPNAMPSALLRGFHEQLKGELGDKSCEQLRELSVTALTP